MIKITLIATEEDIINMTSKDNSARRVAAAIKPANPITELLLEAARSSLLRTTANDKEMILRYSDCQNDVERDIFMRSMADCAVTVLDITQQ